MTADKCFSLRFIIILLSTFISISTLILLATNGLLFWRQNESKIKNQIYVTNQKKKQEFSLVFPLTHIGYFHCVFFVSTSETLAAIRKTLTLSALAPVFLFVFCLLWSSYSTVQYGIEQLHGFENSNLIETVLSSICVSNQKQKKEIVVLVALVSFPFAVEERIDEPTMFLPIV